MNRHLSPLVLVLIATAASTITTLTAQQPQTPPPTTQSPTQPPNKTTPQPGDLVLTGCLQSGPGDTTAGDSKGRIYTLSVASAASPTAATPPSEKTSAASPEIYTLMAAEALGLAKHVGHQVQLTGRLQTPAPQKDAAATAKPGGAHRTFEVSSLKMIAAKCSP
jgi:hypothetical protein